MAEEEDDEDLNVGPILSAALFVLLTVFGVTVGAVVGQQVMGDGFKKSEAAAEEEDKDASDAPPVQPLYDGETKLVRLAPVVTNLASPTEIWIRVEAAVVLDAEVPDPDVLASQISEDVMAFLRTVSLPELQGASGLLHLKEDLNDRAIIRGDAAVRELILEGLVVQ